jgi:hypothetical protein
MSTGNPHSLTPGPNSGGGIKMRDFYPGAVFFCPHARQKYHGFTPVKVLEWEPKFDPDSQSTLSVTVLNGVKMRPNYPLFAPTKMPETSCEVSLCIVTK